MSKAAIPMGCQPSKSSGAVPSLFSQEAEVSPSAVDRAVKLIEFEQHHFHKVKTGKTPNLLTTTNILKAIRISVRHATALNLGRVKR
jgi:hypothetical protein